MALPIDAEVFTIASLLSLVRDFIAFSGRGRVTVLIALMLLGGIVEGLSLALLVPLLALLTGGEKGGHLQHVANSVFDLVGADTDIGRLALIVALFLVAMAVRAAVLLRKRPVGFGSAGALCRASAPRSPAIGSSSPLARRFWASSCAGHQRFDERD